MDLERFWTELGSVADAQRYTTSLLGRVGNEPVFVLTPQRTAPSDKRLLVAAGFHGDETAGCFAVMSALAAMPKMEGFSLSFIPVVNPTGCRRGTRENSIGQDPNRGYSHVGVHKVVVESRILLRNWGWLLTLARDGFLALHEDCDAAGFYLYTFEARATPGPWSRTLSDFAARSLARVPDGRVEGSQVRGGIIFNECQDSMEDRLFHDGVPAAACAEIPGRLPWTERVTGGAALIYSFIRASKLIAARSSVADRVTRGERPPKFFSRVIACD